MIKPFKTGLLTAILSIVALSTHADRLYVQDTNVQAGGECDLNIVLESSDMSQYSAFQFDLVLPEGFETDKNDIKYYKEYFSDSQQYLDIVQLSDVKWRIVSTSATNQRLKGQTGAIMFFRVTASASLPVGNRQGSIQNIVFTKLLANGTTQTVRMDASTYTVSVWKEASLAFDAVNKTYGDAAFTVSPKTNVSGGTITYSSGNTSVVKVSGQTFTIVGAGTAVITANQAATTNYSATSATFTVTVAQREAVLGWSNLSFTYDGNSHVPTAKVTNLVGNDVCNVTVTGAQTNVGSYTATATALSNANYKLPAANTQAFTITSASSTLSFDPVSKTYGDAAFTVTPKTNVSGGAITYRSGNTQVVMVSGQTFTVVGTGTATITAYQAATANYGASSTTFTVTVGQREAVLGWSNLGFTYDGKSHVPTATVQNLVGNDVCNVTVTGAQTNAGSYTATATALSNANYKLPAAKTNGFAVAKASLMIFGGNYVKKQGEPMPQWKAEYNGFVNGETDAVLTKQPLLSCDANENSAPGTYIVTVSGAEAQNYNISYQNGTLIITAADQIVVTARSYSREYGDPNPTFEFNVTGGTLDGTPEIICDAVPKSPVNQYPIIVRKGSISNPNVQFVNGALTVTKAPLTITAKSYTITQGEPMPEFEADYSGFKLNDTPAVLSQQPQLSCAALDSSEPGTFAIRVYGSEARNYVIEEVDGVLTIVAAPQEPELVLTELYVDGDNHEAGQHTIHYTIRNYGGDFNDYVYIFLKVPGIDEVVKSGDFWSIPSKKELRVSKPATLTVFGTYHIWVATDADGQNILGETEWTLLQPEEEKGYTLVVKLNDGSEEKYVLKERPEAWMQGTRLRIESTTMSTAYERTDIEKFYFLDKDGNSSGIKAVAEAETSLTVRQLSNGRLQVSGLADGDAVRVFDLSGRLLTTVKSDGSNSLSIDLSQQPKGVYIININNKRTIKLQVR